VVAEGRAPILDELGRALVGQEVPAHREIGPPDAAV